CRYDSTRSRSMFLLSHHMRMLGRPCSTFSRVTTLYSQASSNKATQSSSRSSSIAMAYSAISAVSASRTSAGTFKDCTLGSTDSAFRLSAHQLGPVGPEAADGALGDAVGEVAQRAAAAHLDDGARVTCAARRLLHHLDRLAVLHADEAGRADEVRRHEPVARHGFVVVGIAEHRLEHLVRADALGPDLAGGD